jgi:CheY-like chemotaxis protein/anti-sigma regulatory factor (Ser/Thr protein kinase)
MKILIIDDQSSNRQILTWLLEEAGHTCIEAENGKEGVCLFKHESPDLIFMDVIMPVMDGYEAAKAIKSLQTDSYVPIIFLTGLTEGKSLSKCLESGGDDFISKPIDDVILQAKVKAHSRTLDLTRQLRNKNNELTALHNRLSHEHEMGEHVLSNAMSRNYKATSNVREFISPMSLFNGDLLLTAPKPTGGIYLFLGDFTGHGLAASIGAIPVSQIFFAMTKKALPLSEIARSINNSLVKFLPDHMFCAAVMLELNKDGDQALVWSGGLPDGLICREGEGIIQKVISQHMPLGVLEPDEFEDNLDIINFQLNDSLILFTDGIIEGVNESGVMFGEVRIEDCLNKFSENKFDNLINEFHHFKGVLEQDDDISVIELIACPVPNADIEVSREVNSLPWMLGTLLEVEQLKSIVDPVQDIVDLMPTNAYFYTHKDIIRSILSELYSNALEHGVLGLDSELKEDEDGFLNYYIERESRLSALTDGYVSISLAYDPTEHPETLIVSVDDSGAGFNFEVSAAISENHDHCYGRGLKLIRSLAKDIKYQNNGASVTLHYPLS